LDLNLALSISALAIGLLGAWPAARDLALVGRSKYSERALRRQAEAQRDYDLLCSNLSFLIAFLALHATLASTFVILSFLIDGSSFKLFGWGAVLWAAKLSCSLLAGTNLGSLLSTSHSIMQRWRRS
jgi:hypothetical protein